MSLRVTEEVMRRGLRICSSGSLWQQRSFPVTKPISQWTHVWSSKLNHTRLARSLVSSVRFYSKGGIPREHLEEHLAPPAESQSDDAASRQTSSSSFTEHLNDCLSPTDVLDLTCQYCPPVRQLSSCMNHMWSTLKKMSEEQQRYERQLMLEHPAFERLLQMAMDNVGDMGSQDISYCLLSMVKLGVPQRGRVVQTYLRTCQEKLNDFDEKGLSIVSSALAQMDSTTNVVALKEGLRLVVEARLPSIKNVFALQTMMCVIGKDAPLGLKRKLERKALSMTEQFSPPNAQHMFRSLATMGFCSKPLLDVCSQIIRENLPSIPFSRLLVVLLNSRHLNYRDYNLFSDISEHMASLTDVCSIKQSIIILSAFRNLNFCPDALMEALAKKVIANPEALKLKDLLCVLKVYSSLNYDLQQRRQQFLDGLSQALESYLPKMSNFELLKAVYHLCMLGHYSAPLQHLLQSDTIERFKTTVPKFLPNQEKMFQTVDLCLRLDRPALPAPLAVPPFVLGDPASTHLPAKPELLESLRSVLEKQTDTELQEAVAEDFYLIDAVITKRQPKRACEESSQAGGAGSPAESSQRIAVICSPRSYCFGTSNLCGPLALKARHLKVLGYDRVVVVDQSLSDEVRTDFLRRHIFPEN